MLEPFGPLAYTIYLHELYSKLLVSLLISPIVVPYIIPKKKTIKEFRL